MNAVALFVRVCLSVCAVGVGGRVVITKSISVTDFQPGNESGGSATAN